MKIFVTDSTGTLTEVAGETVVIELDNGKTIELTNDLRSSQEPVGIEIWGGRCPQPEWTKKDRHQSVSLNVSPIASNSLFIWPGTLK